MFVSQTAANMLGKILRIARSSMIAGSGIIPLQAMSMFSTQKM